MTAIRKTRADRIFDAANVAFMALVLFVMVYPLYFTVIASISEPRAVVRGEILLLPRQITAEAYRNVFRDDRIWLGYRNTIVYTLLGTLWSLALTIPAAYVMSKKQLPGRLFFSWFFLVPMYFSGGLIPTYLIVKDLNLLNKAYTLIVLGGLSIYNMIVTRVFFQTSIPGELFESAFIDGASDFRAFFGIALPLSAPIVAVMALFYGVSRWNEYFSAMIYLSDSAYHPLQLVLRSILLLNQTALANITSDMVDAEDLAVIARQAYMAEAMKYALIFIASAPLLAIYPLVQKHFVKGVMIGSVKG